MDPAGLLTPEGKVVAANDDLHGILKRCQFVQFDNFSLCQPQLHEPDPEIFLSTDGEDSSTLSGMEIGQLPFPMAPFRGVRITFEETR